MSSLPNLVICDHCDYVNPHEEKRLKDVGDEGSWACPACSECNTTYHKTLGFVTVLGYDRTVEVKFL